MNVRLFRLLTLVLAGTMTAFLVVPHIGAQGASDENSKIQQGLSIAQTSGILQNIRGKNISLVGLGSYIVNAQGDCNGCHGNPSWLDGHNPFLGQSAQIDPNGYLAGGAMLFGPIFVPRNLTPNASGLPAGMTLAQFINTIRTGHDRRATGAPPDSDLLQIMPWPIFRNMTDRDLSAIYEFLSSIRCLDPSNRGRCVN
jgi:hypothetical protein